MKKLYILVVVLGSTISALAQNELIASVDTAQAQTEMVTTSLVTPRAESEDNRVSDKAKTEASETKKVFESRPLRVVHPPRDEPPYAETR